MKPIAVVHWQENGKNESMECYSQEELTEFSDQLKMLKRVFYTCMCDINANVPPMKPRTIRTAV